ncbi:MAG: LL-diaminopimelate aminotransferase [Chlamydiia bacterium]|nr:LL-diaminopimelate aminotransferase [Chlamydiia bacterium]
MLKRPSSFHKLSPSYLFPEINRRKEAFLKENPHVELLSLGIGDTVFPLPQVIAKALEKGGAALGTKEGYVGYGQEQGNLKLRTMICERLYPHLTPDEIFISDGAKSDIGRLQNLFGSQVRVGIQDPTYPVYVDGSILQGVQKITLLPCTAKNHFNPKIPKEIDLLYLCNPNNPTGKALSFEELAQIVDFAKTHSITILYDGAYFSYIQDPNLPKSIYDIPGAENVAIEVNSFSKMAGFSGIRLGWTILPKKLKFQCGHSIREDFLRFACTVFNGASNIAQWGGEAVFSDEGWEAIQQPIQYTMKNSKLLKKAFQKEGFTVHGGEHAPYLWIETPHRSSWEVFQEFMEKRHIIVTPGAGYGPSGEHFIRVSAFGFREKIESYLRELL